MANQLQQIVTGGYCIGCGACHYATQAAVSIVWDEYGQLQADGQAAAALSGAPLEQALRVCPFSDAGPDEDVIGRRLFAADCCHDVRIGYFRDLYVGYVAEGSYRASGTSGGVLTWILTELLRQNRIDAVLHVRPVQDPQDGVLFRYQVSRSEGEIRAGAKSRYYPIEMSRVLEEMRQTPGRYAIVGVPCFIKAVRRLAEIDACVSERAVVFVGLVCGHLKSRAFADCFGWQVGIPPGELQEIDFRVKLPDRPASDYGVMALGAGDAVVRPTRELFGSNWGYNFFRYSACDYCDDVFAETADATVGDAWLPAYTSDPAGTSVVIVRESGVAQMLNSAGASERVKWVSSSADEMSGSQAGGLRDRREGLAYRLYLKHKRGKWTPRKRVKATRRGLTSSRRRVYAGRSRLGAISHLLWREAVAIGSFAHFQSKMEAAIIAHNRHAATLLVRCKRWLKRTVIAALRYRPAR